MKVDFYFKFNPLFEEEIFFTVQKDIYLYPKVVAYKNCHDAFKPFRHLI